MEAISNSSLSRIPYVPPTLELRCLIDYAVSPIGALVGRQFSWKNIINICQSMKDRIRTLYLLYKKNWKNNKKTFWKNNEKTASCIFSAMKLKPASQKINRISFFIFKTIWDDFGLSITGSSGFCHFFSQNFYWIRRLKKTHPIKFLDS